MSCVYNLQTWLQPLLAFSISGYTSVRYDRKYNQGGGCATFVKDNIVYQRLLSTLDMKLVIIKVHNSKDNLKIINNPC